MPSLEVFQRKSRLKEVIDQRFAGPVVVDNFLIEVFLLALNFALHAGCVESFSVAVGVSGLSDGFVVNFRTTVQRCQQVVSDGSDVEFVKMSADGRSEKRSESIASDSDFWSSVQVEIFRFDFHPAIGRRSNNSVRRSRHRSIDLFEDRVCRDELRVNRVPKMRQVKAAERSVPVRAVALSAVKSCASFC